MGVQQDSRPVFATQGGGYATFDGGRYVWHSEIPPFINARVGDPIPDEWDVIAANDAARREIEEDLG